MNVELNQKISEIGRLQVEQRRDNREPDNSVEKLKKLIDSLEEENRNIKVYFFPWFSNKTDLHASCVFSAVLVCVCFVCFYYMYTFTSIFIQTSDLTNFSW